MIEILCSIDIYTILTLGSLGPTRHTLAPGETRVACLAAAEPIMPAPMMQMSYFSLPLIVVLVKCQIVSVKK